MGWLCELFKKKPEVIPPATMTVEAVIAKLEEDILIHENWIGYITEKPSLAQTFGDYDWHMAWIEVYQNAIFYLEQVRKEFS